MANMASEDVEKLVLAALEGLGVPYEVVAINPDFADTSEFCREYGYPPGNAGNTIVVSSKKEPKRYSACVVRATDRLDVNKTVRKLMDVRRASFATPEATVALTGMAIGGVAPLALPAGLAVYADRKLMGLEYVILGSGSRSSKIKVAPTLFEAMPNAVIVEGLSLESAPGD